MANTHTSSGGVHSQSESYPQIAAGDVYSESYSTRESNSFHTDYMHIQRFCNSAMEKVWYMYIQFSS